MRLTIDNLAVGKVWIDDIQLHDEFPTSKERSELQSQAFLAVQGLHHGQLTPSARLLANPLTIQLLASPTSTLEPKSTWNATNELGTKPKSGEPALENEEEVPSVAQRVRNWLPTPLRF